MNRTVKQLSGTNTIVSYQFDNWLEFVEHVEKAKSLSNGKQSIETTNHKKQWTGTDSFKHAIELAKYGWKEGLANIKTLSAEILKNTETFKDAIKYDVMGDWYDIGRVIEGDPECACEFTKIRTSPEGNIIKITLNGTVSAVISPKVIQQRGATIAALIDAFENQGKRTEVYLTLSTLDHGNLNCLICLKTADEALDLGVMAFALIHPSTLRRLYFKLVESDPHKYKMAERGYGHPTVHPADKEADILLSHIITNQDFDSIESSRKWIQSKLAEYVKTDL